MDQQLLISLLEKYARGEASPAESAAVTDWLQTVTPAEFDRVLQQCDVPADFRAYPPVPPGFAQELESRLDEADTAYPRSGNIFPVRRLVAAASIAVLLAAAIYWLRQPGPQPAPVAEKQEAPRVFGPGGNKAVLTLGDGSTIVLDSAQNGVLASQGSTRVIKQANGQLAYRMPATGNGNEAVYNTIATPAGGQYQVLLPDGSKVWLNAASSLRFPSRFTGGERSVTLTGEGYFEIAHNDHQPFRVQVNDAVVEVLGTHFNVNAYRDENEVRTTLLQGAVKMRQGAASLQLTPGQQARLHRNGDMKLVRQADTEQAIAWKNGYFQFDKVDLPALMRQIARWYDLEVVYEGPVKDFEFVGKIARTAYLADVLKALESSGVRFRMEGNRLIVTT